MAYTSTAGVAHGPQSRLSAVFNEIGAFFTLFGAAVRVGSAVESRRQPSVRDLGILGIKGPILPSR
jgi:hypothetical protein